MVESPVGFLCSALVALKSIEDRYAAFDASARFSSLPDSSRGMLLTALEQLADTTSDLNVDACGDRVERLQKRIELDVTMSTIRTDIRVLLEVAEDQLRRRFFLHVPLITAHYYAEPDKVWGTAWERYADAQPDMWDASRCFAVGQHSACVFHCMNVLQQGLYSLADHLGVEFKYPIELANWNQIIV
ncbi:MAG TPA: hypothetical protein VJN94_14235, partial [Candidatus Binataceae bacterium]|nr:hypothetical protein [Candidatus Binataceae bacterium]